VLGFAFVIGIIIALPVGIISAYKQYSWFDNIGTFVTMMGYSVPTFFTGLLAIVIFSVHLGWFPSFYNTNHVVDWTSWDSILIQIKQMIMPVAVLGLFNAAALARFTRASCSTTSTPTMCAPPAPKVSGRTRWSPSTWCVTA
jgi:peptide/nickel transport system permease protein